MMPEVALEIQVQFQDETGNPVPPHTRETKHEYVNTFANHDLLENFLRAVHAATGAWPVAGDTLALSPDYTLRVLGRHFSAGAKAVPQRPEKLWHSMAVVFEVTIERMMPRELLDRGEPVDFDALRDAIPTKSSFNAMRTLMRQRKVTTWESVAQMGWGQLERTPGFSKSNKQVLEQVLAVKGLVLAP